MLKNYITYILQHFHKHFHATYYSMCTTDIVLTFYHIFLLRELFQKVGWMSLHRVYLPQAYRGSQCCTQIFPTLVYTLRPYSRSTTHFWVLCPGAVFRVKNKIKEMSLCRHQCQAKIFSTVSSLPCYLHCEEKIRWVWCGIAFLWYSNSVLEEKDSLCWAVTQPLLFQTLWTVKKMSREDINALEAVKPSGQGS